MESLRTAMANIGEQLGKLSPSQRMLIGSLCVIAVMALFLVGQYAGKGEMVELMPAEGNGQVLATLRGGGIQAEERDGQVYVPPNARRAAMAQLGEAGMLPNDTTILFGNLIDKQSWQNSRQQNQQIFNIALQNELGRTIALWDDIASATVMIDAPDANGIGRVYRAPTASATVFTADGSAIKQNTVDAIAQFIAGAKAGLDAKNIRVIDGTTGQQRRVRDEEMMSGNTYLERVAAVEMQTRQKLGDLLSYIPGVIVTVTAQVDVTRVSEQRNEVLPKGEGSLALLSKETIDEESMQGTSQGAEPGVRSNQTADINRGGGSGTSTNSNQAETEFATEFGRTVKSIVDPRGHPTMLAASVAIPRGYIVGLIQATLAAPAEGEEPEPITEAQIDQRFELERERISAAIRPHVRTGVAGVQTEGDVVVSLIPLDIAMGGPVQSAGVMGMLTGGGGGGGGLIAMGGGMVDTIVLGVLSLVAVGMMLMMVKKSGKRQDLPTAEELVGLPPTLEADSDLIGEAEEGDSPMTGIEIGDGEVEQVKLREQVSTMVAEKPEVAATLVSRWLEEAE